MNKGSSNLQLWQTAAVELLFKSSGIGLVIVDYERRVISVNQAVCMMLGYTAEELQGLTIDQITAQEDLKLTYSLFEKAAQPNIVLSFEKRYRHKNGSFVWCKGRSEPLGEISTVASKYRLVMLENITARKAQHQHMQQLATIVDATEDAMFCSDVEGRITFWNKGAQRMYGYHASEVLGKPAIFLLAKATNNDEQVLLSRLNKGEKIRHAHGKTRHKDGSVVDVSVEIYPLFDLAGDLLGHAAVHRNIAELNMLNEQLRSSQRMETAGMLAGAIAHDFNNILTVIKGSCEVLMPEMPLESERRRYLDLISRSSEQAAALTQQLLTFSRRQKVLHESLSPARELERLRPLMQRTLGEDISLTTVLNSDWKINEDSTQFEQIVLNIAINARQAMPQGGNLVFEVSNYVHDAQLPVVEPHWESFSPGALEKGEYVQVTIRDEGSGMPYEVLSRIFEPFFTTREAGKGSGLGLSVVYGMVTQAGGGLQVSSKAGVGTVFRVFLPHMEAVAVPVSKPDRKSAAIAGRILVLDDDANVRGLVARVLEFAGYQVVQAESAEQVLANETLGEADLIISDVVMPGMSGPEFAKLWCERHPDARFLFMSGYIENLAQTNLLGAANFLAKPFKPAVLVQKVQEQLAS